MDTRRSINTRVWADDWFENLNPTEKLLWLYLLTNSQTNMLGIYEISIKRISFETGINKPDIERIMEGFGKVRKGFYINSWVVLPNWIKNQAMNTNMMTSARNLYYELPNELIIKLMENGFESFESLSNGSVILPKIEKEIEIEKEKESGNGIEKNLPTNTPFILKWIEQDKEAYEYIVKFFPKMFKFKRPLTPLEHKKLCSKYKVEKVMDIYGQIENKPDVNKKYDWAYMTAFNWLKRS